MPFFACFPQKLPKKLFNSDVRAATRVEDRSTVLHRHRNQLFASLIPAHTDGIAVFYSDVPKPEENRRLRSDNVFLVHIYDVSQGILSHEILPVRHTSLHFMAIALPVYKVSPESACITSSTSLAGVSMGNKPSATAKTEAPGGANSRSRKRSSAQERQKISAARKTRHETAHLKRKAVRELSCAATNRATQRRLLASDGAVGLDKDKAAEKEKQLGHELAEHLKSIAPFNKRWHVTDTISEGAYGVVFAVKDEKTGTSGVIKVAKAKDVGDATNQTAEWEGYVLERMFRQSPEASVVRLLDKGMLADQYGQGMEFMVLEKAELRIRDYIDDGKTAKEKRLRTTKVMLQMLKSIIDLHTQGFLHRDLKPDNMGIMSNESPIALLFDLGMARMYTDGEAHVRQPRTSVAFRGTPEWASGHAQKCREQTRYDDLVAWLYCAVELYAYAECPQTDQPLPWTYRGNPKAVRYLKSVFCPARLLLRVCPQQFYSINTYLCMTNRFKTPDYGFIVEKVREAVDEITKLPDEKEPTKNEAKREAAPQKAKTKG